MRSKSSDIAGGRVSEVPFARIFGAIALRGLTGVMRLEQDGRRYALYFQDGAIADADSSAPEDTLGRVALEAGLVENGAVGDSLRRMAQDATKSQRDTLVELGALRGDDLERALRLTLTRRTLRIFMLQNASFTFEEQEHGRLEGGPVEPRWSLYRGLRMHYDERRLDLEMSGAFAGQAFRLSIDPAQIYDAFGFSNDERVVINYLDRARTNGLFWELGDLVDACLTLPRATVLAIVHALHGFENIELRPAATVTRYRKPRREPTQQLERQTLEIKGSPPMPGGAAGPRGQIPGVKFTPPTGAPINQARGAPTERNPPVEPAQPWARANGTNPPVSPFITPSRTTGTSTSSSGQTIPVANRQTNPSVQTSPRTSTLPPSASPRTGTLPPSAVRPSGPTTVLGPTGGLRNSAPQPPTPTGTRQTGPQPPTPTGTRQSGPMTPFGGNQRVVTDPGRPGAVTRDQITAKFAEVEQHADHFVLLEIERNSTSEQAKAAYFRLVKIYHSDKLALARLEQLRPQVDRIMGRLTEAYGVLSDDTRRANYLRVLSQGGEDAAKRLDDEATAQATKILIAEEHFKRGEMALRRESWGAAIEEFQSAVEQNDTEADYHAYLGWAKWRNATDKAAIQAEVRADLSRALKLSSNKCIDALFFRGRMFNELGDIDKAYRYFNQVLSLNEDHVEAARELRVLEMRRKSGGKGLFDLFRKKPGPKKPNGGKDG